MDEIEGRHGSLFVSRLPPPQCREPSGCIRTATHIGHRAGYTPAVRCELHMQTLIVRQDQPKRITCREIGCFRRAEYVILANPPTEYFCELHKPGEAQASR